ncbi:putative disease resistance protein RGA1 [Syzygium oleosum]|uniref:putative disease resistance protein RGA1 n=1 Tax=Syzygium oleosum TaxID=219896 RepID=UPI0024B9E666|nr:putative disease resistance protein RGA1 [Syzygium oleosum]
MEQRESTSEAYLRQLIQSFKRLRILDMHATNVRKVPRSICKLKHLTYLDLSHNSALKRLPNSIKRLQNLQTLNLSHCIALEELPSEIRKLVNLWNLDIDDKARAKNYCRLRELNGLNEIQGSLRIENLGCITNAVLESKAANLIGKHSLESLELHWGYHESDDAVIRDRDEALLDGLRPHSNLRNLMIDGYRGESFPRWMMETFVFFLPNLVEVSLQLCQRCKHLPQLGQLPHLESLWIWFLTELEYIELDHSSTLTTSFPRLLSLRIGYCENLKAMPLIPHLEELMLSKVNPELINHIFGLNKLKRLIILEMELLECLPECLESPTSLESLIIWKCPRLTSLSLSMRNLSNLQHLNFRNCEELDLSKDESGNILDLQGLKSLRSVDIVDVPKLASLPPWLLQANSLEQLSIKKCLNLKALSEQIEALQSLQSLEIVWCPSLRSLPEGM